MAATKLDELIDRAVDLERRIRAIPERPKLNPKAYVAMAMAQAKANAQRLNAIEEQLAGPGCVAIEAFVLALRRKVVEVSNYSEPPADGPKLVRIYGKHGIEAELQEAKITSLECLALAARRSAAMYPDRFGTCEDVKAAVAEREKLVAQRDAVFREMETAVSGVDIDLDFASVSRSERDNGLCRVRLKRTRSVLQPGWPEYAVASALTNADIAKANAEEAKKLGRRRAQLVEAE